ncbi:MAG: serine/threonine-protein kinase [Planctomycetota bacterium]
MPAADTASDCLAPPELECLAAGGAVTAAAQRHLAGCALCQAALAEIRACNTFLDRHRAAFRSSTGPAAPAAPVIPGYAIATRVGTGGQGVVYKGVQLATHRKVAIKLLRDGVLANGRQRFRFERETELLASLRHPNIVTLFDRGRTPDGHDYIVMEWVHGLPLDQHLRERRDAMQRGEAQIRAKLTLFAGIAHAIQHAHGGSVIHRDLKPGNILVDDAGEPHVIDFGLARPERGGRGPLPTMTEEFAGTRPYASPEQVAGKADQMRVTTDVYSLGVILYEMLTGGFPYPIEGSPSDIDRHIQSTEPRPPRALNRAIPEDVASIILKALRKNAVERYATAGALAADVDDFLAGRPIAAKKDSTWYVLRRTLRRHRRTLTKLCAAALVLGLGTAATATYGVLSARAAQERARAVAEAERAAALGLVLQSMGRPALHTPAGGVGRLPSPWLAFDAEDYAGRGLVRLAYQLRFGWLGDRRRLEAATASLIAGVYREGGVAASAEELTRQAAMYPGNAGTDHPETTQAVSDLAEILLVRRRFAEAARYGEQALEVERRAHGDGSLHAARSRELLARIALARGDAATAARLAARAAEDSSAQLGDESADVARCQDTHAAALLAVRDLARAEAEALCALRVRITLLPDEHLAVVESLRRLAAIREAQGEAGGAGGPSGDASAGAVADLRALADELEALSAPPEARRAPVAATLRRMLALKEGLLGPRHKGLLSTLAALALEATVRLDFAELELAFAQAAAVIEHTQGPASLALANCLEDLGNVRIEQLGRSAAGLADLERSIDIWWALPANQRDDFQAAVNERWVAQHLALDGQWERAAARYRHCLEILARQAGPEHYAVAMARSGYGWVLLHTGRAAEAEPEAQAALELGARSRAVMAFDQRALQHLFLGMILAEQGRFAEAEPAFQRAWLGEEAAAGLPPPGWVDLKSQAGLQPLAPTRPARQRLVEYMAKICTARGDAAGAARWQAELPPASPN